MAIQSLPLTAVTADSLKQQMINAVKVNFPDWTDLLDSNNMIVLIELFASIAELQYTYQNHNARECFLQYALDPRNVLAHAADMAYRPSYQTPSFVVGNVQSTTPVTANTTIPAGTKFPTQLDGVFYETDTVTTIAAGQTLSGSVMFKQQESWTQNFTGTGAPDQTLTLDHSPVIPSSISMTINGNPWTAVDTFVDADSTSLVFIYSVDADGIVHITFGDGVSGAMPPVSAAGIVNFKTGGGKAGAIGANQLLQSVSTVLDAGNSQPLTLTGVNAVPATPGADRETSDQIRVNAPANLKAPRVLLSIDDVTAAAKQVSGVQTARAINWETDPAIPRHLTQVFIYPIGGGLPTAGLKAAVESYLTVTKPLVMGTLLQLVDPTYRTLNFNISLTVKANYDKSAVSVDIQNMLTTLFDPTQTNIWGFTPDFGQAIYLSQILMILQQIPGVEGLTINSPGDTLLNYYEFPVLGTVTVI